MSDATNRCHCSCRRPSIHPVDRLDTVDGPSGLQGRPGATHRVSTQWTPESAARLIASMAWPNERHQNNAAWSARLITDRDMRHDEYQRALARHADALDALIDARWFLDDRDGDAT